jgi:hypothetical protein
MAFIGRDTNEPSQMAKCADELQLLPIRSQDMPASWFALLNLDIRCFGLDGIPKVPELIRKLSNSPTAALALSFEVWSIA